LGIISLVCIRNIGIIQKQLLKNGPLAAIAFYSRRSNSKSSEPPYKFVRGRLGVDEDHQHFEGGPNWELLSPTGNRFYLPNSCGPAWQNNSTTTPAENCLDELVDFFSKDTQKLWLSYKECPVLLKKSLVELFPTPEVSKPDPLTIITVKSHLDTEQGAKHFVLAAREICRKLRMHGHWADFMNPFSGRPFYSFTNGKTVYKCDDRFRGIGMKVENVNDCIVISSDFNDDTVLDQALEGHGFSGSIFTNICQNKYIIEELIDD